HPAHHDDVRLDAEPLQRLEDREAIHPGHQHVEEHDVDRALLQDVESGASVGGGEDFAAGFENCLIRVEHTRIVVHGQYNWTDSHRPSEYSRPPRRRAPGYICGPMA